MRLALALLLVALNLAAFLAHGLDKWRARRGGARIPERTLLLLALPLAAPGAWAGMHFFRHKTVKRSFRLKMAGATALNALFLWGLWELWALIDGA